MTKSSAEILANCEAAGREIKGAFRESFARDRAAVGLAPIDAFEPCRCGHVFHGHRQVAPYTCSSIFCDCAAFSPPPEG